MTPASDIASSDELAALRQRYHDLLTRYQQLEHSEAGLRDFIENASVALHWVAGDGTILRANQSELDLLGYQADEYIGHHIAEFHVDPPVIEDILRRLSAGETIRNYEARLRCKDGTIRHVSISSNGRFDSEQVFQHTRCITVDVTERKRAEEVTAYLAAIVSSSHDAIISKTLNGIVTSWNAAAEALYGYTAHEMIGQPILRILPPDRKDEEERFLKRLRAGERIDNYETVRQHKDGHLIEVSLTISPVVNTCGNIIGASKIARNITQHKAAEKRLRSSEERFRGLVGIMPAAVYTCDAEGRLTFYNDRAADLWGRVPQLGDPDQKFCGALKLFSPDGSPLPHAQTPMARAIFTGASSRSTEVVIERPDGTRKTALVNIDALKDANGDIIGAINVFTDITARKQAEAELQESEERFRTLADNISQLAWMMDDTGSVFWYNQRWFDYTGTHLTEMEGWGWETVHHPDYRDRVVASKRRALERQEPWEETFPLRGRDGQYRWFLTRAIPIRNKAGRVIRWFGTNTDVTELRETQAALLESQERLQSLAGDLESLVERRTNQLQESEERLRVLATELNLAEQRQRKQLATELHDHLQQLLVLGKLKLGQGKRLAVMTPACLDMISEVDQVLSEALTYTRTLVAELSPPVLRDQGLAAGLTWLGQYMKKYGMDVSVSVPFDHESIPEDQAILLFQSVRELLINAWKHSGTTTASVVMVRQADALSIEVQDNGRGFDPAVLPKKDVSSGFGLFSIRERMKWLGGLCEIHSAPEAGTQCVLVLPLPKPSQEQRSENATPTLEMAFHNHSARGKNISVLLVDDHAMMRQGLKSVLSSYADVEVIMEATDGIEAIEAVDRCHPSVVIMDINLPRMNGIEATTRIKQRYPNLPIIGLSVNAGEANQEAMAKAGAEILLTKEGAVEQLYVAIRGLNLKRTSHAS